jgi:DNA repair exonuclease SbcCD ATPase subunit
MADRPGRGAISASPDDGAGRRRSAGTSRRRGGESGGGSRMFGNAIMAILIGGLVVAGWFIAEQYQRLEAESDALADARSRLEVLEDRLRVTDEALTERGESTSEQINFWESEIRKLWAVSNDRNQNWIKDNQKAIASLQQSLSSLQAASREIQGTVGRHESAFAEQQQLVDQFNSLQMQIQQVSRSQRDLVDKVNSAQQTVAQLRSGLADRVEETEQAVAAIDAYRLQLNSRLADIERRINSLAGSATL